MSLHRLLAKICYALSAERRDLLQVAHDNLITLGLPADGFKWQLATLRRISYDKNVLPHVAEQSGTHRPSVTIAVLSGFGSPTSPEHLSDQHFVIHSEIVKLYETRNWQNEMVFHDHVETLRYALSNPDDWGLIRSILVDRGILDHEEVMMTLRQLKAAGTMALSGGAL